MSESYWRFVEPIWDTVSIYDGGDVFLRGFKKATDKQKTLFAAHWTQSEVMNGGLGQFFTNPTGVLAPEAVKAFEVIGMPKCAEALNNSMKFFGHAYPRDQVIRESILDQFYEVHGEEAIPLEDLEDIIATEIEDENGGFEDAADRYANQRQ